MKKFIQVLDHNLNFDKREQHWIRFVLFSKFVVKWNIDTIIPMINSNFERKVWSEQNTTYFIFKKLTISVLSGKHIYNGGAQ